MEYTTDQSIDASYMAGNIQELFNSLRLKGKYGVQGLIFDPKSGVLSMNVYWTPSLTDGMHVSPSPESKEFDGVILPALNKFLVGKPIRAEELRSVEHTIKQVSASHTERD